MSLAKQLYQLQEVDLEIESNEQAVQDITSQIGDSEAIAETQRKLVSEQERLKELTKQQQSVEWEIDDITTKLTTTEEQLYSGRIGNPKELTNLQHEIDILKNRRNQHEDKALEIMEQVEQSNRNTASLNSELKKMESEWQNQQKELKASLEQHKTTLDKLNRSRQRLADGIDTRTLNIYQETKRHKGTAVARVEQGMCCGCRISLPVNELQRTKSGDLVQCSSCGRILFLA